MSESKGLIIPMKILNIGVGEGGSRMAYENTEYFNSQIEDTKYHSKTLVLNLSEQDIGSIKLPSDCVCKLGGDSVHGAGKDRNLSEKLFNAMNAKILEWITPHVVVSEGELPYETIIVHFSSAGGTGSGIGPKLSTLLNVKEVQERFDYEPIVFGNPITPDLGLDEGTAGFDNTANCLAQIQTYIENKVSRFFMVDNGEITEGNRDAKHAMVNKLTAQAFFRYFCIYKYGSRSLDKADRINLLKMMGLHSLRFISEGTNNPSTFVCPQGIQALAIGYEVNEKVESEVEKYLVRNGITYDYPIKGVYGADDNTPSILHIAGFDNIKKYVEKYRNRSQQIKEERAASLKNYQSNAIGLEGLKEEAEWRKEQYGANQAASIQDIMKL